MNLSTSGLALLKKLEGLSLVAYQDSAGIPTIGYGHVMKKTDTSPITEAEAEALLRTDITRIERVVQNIPAIPPLTQNQFDALVIFVYNIGPYAFNTSTLRKILTGKKSGNAAAQFDKWVYVKVGGEKKIVQGLVNRRKAERELFEL